jgi:cold shock CspA family protein
LQDAYQNCPSELIDERLKERVEDAGPLIRTCVNFVQDNQQYQDRAEKLLEWFNNDFALNDAVDTMYQLNESLKGTIDSFYFEKGFGFILAKNGQRFFFRRRNLANLEDWHRLQKNSQVIFWKALFQNGDLPQAENVTLLFAR